MEPKYEPAPISPFKAGWDAQEELTQEEKKLLERNWFEDAGNIFSRLFFSFHYHFIGPDNLSQRIENRSKAIRTFLELASTGKLLLYPMILQLMVVLLARDWPVFD